MKKLAAYIVFSGRFRRPYGIEQIRANWKQHNLWDLDMV